MSALLDQMLLLRKVPQSLLFIQGTQTDAVAFAKKLFGSGSEAKIDSGNHPDLHLYLPEEKSGLHSMATIQTLIREMALPPYEGRCKVFVIDQADKMLPSGSNALLKTLEEPPEDTYFILLSNEPDRLLSTILSRVSPVTFQRDAAATYDLSPYIALAKRGEWDELLDSLKNLEEEDPFVLFQAFLESEKDPAAFERISKKIAEGQKALEHNVKLRTVLCNLFLEISG